MASINVHEPLAIVGVGLRLPGGIHTTEDLWSLLVEKKSTRCKVPKDRFNSEAFYSKSRKAGATGTEYAHFLAESDNLQHMDTSMFSMGKEDTKGLDPQARMLLEVVYECMQNAGQGNWRGKNTGCFVGVFGEDWSDLHAKDPQSGEIPGFNRICGQHDFALSNRVSYEFDLKGPSYTTKAACSSSLIALHNAVLSIRAGDCDSAIVAGTSLIFTPTATASMWPVLSPNGMCSSFDASADGYARGEAINAIYVKPLSHALRDGDSIRSIIRNTATNFDGKTMNFSIPNAEMQEAMMRKAYEEAGLDPKETPFVEAHGTGTRVGDPPEANAIARVFGSEQKLFLGSVKPNLGHSEGASGLNSVLKCILALERQAIPPNINFSNPNPNIAFEESNMVVPVETTSWPKNRPKRVSINCFGVGGANAHVILEALDSFQKSETLPVTNGVHYEGKKTPKLFVASAASEKSLVKSILEHEKYMQNHPSRMEDLSYSMCRRREHLRYRAFGIKVGDVIEFTTPRKENKLDQITMIFTGQGAQWAGMAKELISDYTAFEEDIDQLSLFLSDIDESPKWNIKDELLRPQENSNLDMAEFAQPITTAVQIALVKLLRRWEIYPSAVIGHSSGEIAAAYAANAITAKEAMLISYYRGKVASTSPKGGSMAAVGLGKEEVLPFLEPGVVVACENSPRSVTLSGDEAALDALCQRIRKDMPDTFVRPLKVNVAYHSHHMQAVGKSYEQLLGSQIKSDRPSIPMFSSVTGVVVSKPSQLDAPYWKSNLENPVLFNTAMQNLIENSSEAQIFLEVGPHGALSGPTRQILGALRRSKDHYVSVLSREQHSTEAVLRAVGNLYLCGAKISFEKIIPCGKLLTDLPLYQWSHDTEYWSESRVCKEWRLREFPHHELLGSRTLESSDLQPEWRNVLHTRNVPWLQDHQVFDQMVFPFAGFVAMAGEAIRRLTNCEDHTFKQINVQSALLLNYEEPVELLTSFRPVRLTNYLNSVRWEFTVLSHNGQRWTKHCAGEVSPGKDSVPSRTISQYPRSLSNIYFGFKQKGLQLGPCFQGLGEVSAAPGKQTASGTLTPTIVSESTYALHPTVIDNCLQVLGIALCEGVSRRIPALALPVMLEDLYICGGKSISLKAEAVVIQKSLGRNTANFWACSGEDVVLNCGGALLRPFQNDILSDSDTVAGAKLLWEPDLDFVDASTLNQEEFLDLAAHSNPVIRVLEIAFESSAPDEVLKQLITKGGHSMYSSYTYAGSQEMIEKAKDQLKGYERVIYQVLAPDSNIAEMEYSDEGFDFIRIPKILASPESLLTLRKALHPRGWLFMGLKDEDSNIVSSQKDRLEYENGFIDAGFSLPATLSASNSGDHRQIFVTRPLLVDPIITRLTLLVPSGKLSLFTLAVQNWLENRGTMIEVRTLNQEISTRQDIVSLLDVESPFLKDISSSDFTLFQNLIGALAPNALLWITRSAQITASDPHFASSLGLLRTLRQELVLSIATLELDTLEEDSISAIGKVLNKFRGRGTDDILDPDYEFVLHSGTIHIGRYHPVSVEKDLVALENMQDCRLDIGQPGLLQTLKWVPFSPPEPGEYDVVIVMKAVGINFKDVLIAMGILNFQAMGFEGSGVIEAVGSGVTNFCVGDRVFFLQHGCLRTRITIPHTTCLKLPEYLSFEEGATIPVVYITAIYCLIQIGHLQKGESVLIHSACGGVGIAAIEICQKFIGSDIYVTVGNLEKAQYLMDTYGIPRERIFKSRNTSFLNDIMTATSGRGVDLVLNSLSGELLHASWKCVAEFGRMIEIGKRDFLGKAQLSMDLFEGNRSFFGVDISMFNSRQITAVNGKLGDFCTRGMAKPISPMKVFPATKIEDSFKYMQNSARMGKVVTSMDEIPRATTPPKVHFDPGATYLLVGGLGGIGRATSTWMVENGARHFMYISRSAGKTPQDQAFLAELECQGCSAQAVAGSVADPATIQQAVKIALKPIKGVFQLAMAVPTNAFLDLNYSDWTAGLEAKIDGTWNLHTLPDLDFLILASSIGACFGHLGRSNYAAANTFLDAFVHYRHGHGLPAAVIDIGLVGDLGYVMEHPAVYEQFKAAGSYFVGEKDILLSLQWAMHNSQPSLAKRVGMESPGRISMGIRTLKPLSDPDNHLLWARDRRMAIYYNLDVAERVETSDEIKQFIARMKANPSLLKGEDAFELIKRDIGVRIYSQLLKPVDEIDYTQKLEDLGVDSLMMIEIRNWSKRNFCGVEFSTLEMMNAGTIEGLGRAVLKGLRKKFLPEEEEEEEERKEEEKEKEQKEEEEKKQDVKEERAMPAWVGSTFTV